jgi:hypothetical protein
MQTSASLSATPLARAILLAAAITLPAWAAAAASPRLPDYYPTCPSPQPSAPQHPGGGTTNARNAVVWNGRDFATVYLDYNDARLHFRRYYADGSPVGPSAVVSTLFGNYGDTSGPALAWSGSEYLAVWSAKAPSDGSSWVIYAVRLAADGTPIGSDIRVSYVGTPPSGTLYAVEPAAASSGNGFMIAWTDARNAPGNGFDVYATFLNPDGSIGNGGAAHDVAIDNFPTPQQHTAIVWSPASGRYMTALEDSSVGGRSNILTNACSQSGVCTGETLAVTDASGGSYRPSLADNGYGFGLTWDDNRAGNFEVYFTQLDLAGYKAGPDVRVSNNASFSGFSRLVWTGAEYGIFWADNLSGIYSGYYQRMSSGGSLIGSGVPVTAGGLSACCFYIDAAFGRYGMLLVGSTGTSSQGNLIVPVGCSGDVTSPSCPANPLAYNVTGNSATFSWAPSVDNESDIAYYNVYQNNALVAKTDDTFYNAAGLGLNTTYNFYVQPVNAYQLVNGGCAASVYVHTNASLTLTVNKSDPSTALAWTNVSLNNYNVFRGANPQVMSLIGATPLLSIQDPNALIDSVSYFYSVDDPGQ